MSQSYGAHAAGPYSGTVSGPAAPSLCSLPGERLPADHPDALHHRHGAGRREHPQRQLQQDRQVEDRRRARSSAGSAPAGRRARRCRPWRRSPATRPSPGRSDVTAPITRQTRRAEVEVAVARAGEVERQPAEDRAVADAVERGVEEGPEGRRAAGRARHRAVDQVAEDERGDHQHADRAARPAGRRPARRRRRPRCRRAVTASGLTPSLKQQPDDRRQHDALPEGLEPLQHEGVRLRGRRPPRHPLRPASSTLAGSASTGAKTISAAPRQGESRPNADARMMTSLRGDIRVHRSRVLSTTSWRASHRSGQRAAEHDHLGVEHVDDGAQARRRSSRPTSSRARHGPRVAAVGRRDHLVDSLGSAARRGVRPGSAGGSRRPWSPSSRRCRSGTARCCCRRPAGARPRRRTRASPESGTPPTRNPPPMPTLPLR